MVANNFEGQFAIVTGATAGIGLSTASLLASKGVSIVLNARNSNRLEDLVKNLKKVSNAEVFGISGDITHPLTRKNIVEEAIQRFGGIDILINNAGGGINQQEIEYIDEDAWNQSIDFNLNSCYHMCRLVIPWMKQNKYGRIVNISSVAGRFRGRLSGPDYSAAKSGIFGLTRHLAWTYAKDGILVNAVAPGFVATERALQKWEKHTKADKELIMNQIAIQRFAEPAEIANAIAFLASKEASYITGIVLDVNGGFFMS
jgi:3-oxoacyl-[acyl-carrier protein] reductase